MQVSKSHNIRISCIIIDNDPSELNLLREYIVKTASLELTREFSNCHDALAFLKSQQVEIIFTEIDIPVMSGLDLAALLPREQKFVFFTRCREYALSSFSHRVIDYMLKPATYSRFCETVAKISMDHLDGSKREHTPSGRFFTKGSGKIMRVNFDEVLFIKGEKEYVSLNFDDRRLLIYKRMKEMECLLPSNFIRVHISYIININYVDEVTNSQLFVGQQKIPVSNSYRAKFQEYIHSQL